VLIARTKLARLVTVEQHAPRGGREEAAEQVEQRGFSDAVLARENQRAAGRNDQIRFDENPKLSVAKRGSLELES
jgi:hypothetical protein